MHIEFDRNNCCTALHIKNFNSGISQEYLDRYLPKRPDGLDYGDYPDKQYPCYITRRVNRGWKSSYEYKSTLTFDIFAMNLSTLGHNFLELTLVDEHGGFYLPYGVWEPSKLSMIFGFTSTGDNSDRIPEYLKEFGFTPVFSSDSEKYKSSNDGQGSRVTMWCMNARDFAKRCEELFKKYEEIYGPDASTNLGGKAA